MCGLFLIGRVYDSGRCGLFARLHDCGRHCRGVVAQESRTIMPAEQKSVVECGEAPWGSRECDPRACQQSIALLHSSPGETQASPRRMVTFEIGHWTLRPDLRAFCKKLRQCRICSWRGGATPDSRLTAANMQQFMIRVLDRWLTHIY